MLGRLGIKSEVRSSVADIDKAEKLILPGVGSFDYGMGQLEKHGLIEVLNKKALEDKIPVLGICLGVQLMTESSEEGIKKGLGWIGGKTIAFDRTKLSSSQKIPHMGWSPVFNFGTSRLFNEMYEDPKFYFVHSYHLQLDSKQDVLVEASYGYAFAAGIEHDNIVGVQFHPEKSHKYGMKILENFSKLY